MQKLDIFRSVRFFDISFKKASEIFACNFSLLAIFPAIFHYSLQLGFNACIRCYDTTL